MAALSRSETIHAQRWKNTYANKNKQMLPKHVSAGGFTLSGETKGAIFLHSYSYMRLSKEHPVF